MQIMEAHLRRKNVLGWVPEQQKEKKRKKDLVLLGLRRDIMGHLLPNIF